MTNSGRRPVNKAGSTSSGRKPGASRQPDPLEARARTGRGRPGADDQDDGASTAKKVMFFGTLALVVIVLGLFVFRWGDLTAPEPKVQPKVVIREQDKFDEVNALRSKADKQFLEAKKLTDNAARTKGIHAAMDTLSQAMDKLNKLSEMPQYQSDDYSANFADLDKMGIDMKRYRDAIHID